jgi:hypothetical protein
MVGLGDAVGMGVGEAVVVAVDVGLGVALALAQLPTVTMINTPIITDASSLRVRMAGLPLVLGGSRPAFCNATMY